MPYNGSGTFTRNQDWSADRDAGSPSNIIDADKMDDEDDNFKSGFDLALTRDGQATATADLPMGGFKHTNVDDPALRSQYASAKQTQDGILTALTSVAGTDTVTGTAPLSMVANVTNQVFTFVAAGTNTGATTLNINSIGALAIQKNGAALVAGDITSGDSVQVAYDGTQYQMLTPARTPVLTAGSIPDSALVEGSTTNFKVSSNDTTAGDLEAKLLVGAGLTLSTQNDGGNETRTIDTDINGLSDVTITAADEIMYGDVTDSNNRKKDTVQGILDLVPTVDVSGVPKAYAEFDGTGTPALNKSLNVSSLVDNGTGDYTLNFTNNMSDANFGVNVTTGTTSQAVTGSYSARAVGSVTVITMGSASGNVQSGTNRDNDFNTVAVFGDLA